MEWLRPLVHSNSKSWDYCVLWRIGDDPSRFIQWVDCCCSGAAGSNNNVKKETELREEETTKLGLFCRDLRFEHPISTAACEALSLFPSSMPLYPGIHGEVVISTEPRWFCLATTHTRPYSSTPRGLAGTRVLIPVFGGLVELFAAKHIDKDETLIESIRSHCHIPLKPEAVTAHGYSNLNLNEHCLDPLLEGNIQNLHHSSHLLSLIPQMQFLLPLTQPNSNLSLEASSSGSDPRTEPLSFAPYASQLSQDGQLELSIGKSSGLRKSKHNENFQKQQAGFPDCNKRVPKLTRRSDRDDYKSKNLVVERNRRSRIKNGLFALRALVPKISKMDKAATLGDASDYIIELQNEVNKLSNEIEITGEEGCRMRTSNMELRTSTHEDNKHLPFTKINQDSSGLVEKKRIEVQPEVDQISERHFLLKFLSEQNPGGFGRLMETIHSLGFQILDANITTFNGKVLNILQVEMAEDLQLQSKKLRESLIELTGQ